MSTIISAILIKAITFLMIPKIMKEANTLLKKSQQLKIQLLIRILKLKSTSNKCKEATTEENITSSKSLNSKTFKITRNLIVISRLKTTKIKLHITIQIFKTIAYAITTFFSNLH